MQMKTEIMDLAADLPRWHEHVPLMRSGYPEELLAQVKAQRQHATIYPPQDQIFAALHLTPFDAVKVVIVGQDPYHGAGQANGLAFAVAEGIKPPPSLRNIFKEVVADVYDGDAGENAPFAASDLTAWAEQGVLLLNATLTVRAGEAGSHADLGWQALTDDIIRALSEQRTHIVFMLWGKYAQAKRSLIDEARHLILTAPHPSPLSAWRGFFGCRHFSQANEYLAAHGQEPIRW
jgi:uracil-DNA glycosylase